jgi:hypothetical protein
MKWIPPRSLADRSKWVEEHPWIAGCFFGFLLAVLLTIWGVTRTSASIWFGLVLAIPVWLVTWVLLAVLVKRRFGERPNGDSYPSPTWLRQWSRASDRFVFWFMVIGIVGALVSVSDLIARPRDVLDAVVGVVGWTWVAITTWAERRRRVRR